MFLPRNQISAKRGTDSRFILEANLKASNLGRVEARYMRLTIWALTQSFVVSQNSAPYIEILKTNIKNLISIRACI